jgi:SAM-dependent methyltransferase
MEGAPDNPTSPGVKAQKADYYSNLETVEHYEYRRFGRGGGAYVAQRESEAIVRLIRRSGLTSGRALDCPCGTGRFIPLLQASGLEVLAADVSGPMLDYARRHKALGYLQGSADHLPLEEASVQVWLMSRFCFHFPDPSPFFFEAARVLAPGGVLILDAYNWTPRSWIPGQQAFLGGRTAIHSRAAIQLWANSAGLMLEETVSVFAVAPYIYSFLPLWLTRTVEAIAEALAPGHKTKTY